MVSLLDIYWVLDFLLCSNLLQFRQLTCKCRNLMHVIINLHLENYWYLRKMLQSSNNYYWINFLTGSCGWVDGWELEIQWQKGSEGTAEITAVEHILGQIRSLWGCQDCSRVVHILRFWGWVLNKSYLLRYGRVERHLKCLLCADSCYWCDTEAACDSLCNGEAKVAFNSKNKNCSASLKQAWIWVLVDENAWSSCSPLSSRPSQRQWDKVGLSCASPHSAIGHSSETGKEQSFVHSHKMFSCIPKTHWNRQELDMKGLNLNEARSKSIFYMKSTCLHITDVNNNCLIKPVPGCPDKQNLPNPSMHQNHCDIVVLEPQHILVS